MDWYQDETQAESEITVAELEALCLKIKAQRDVCDDHKATLKAANEVLEGLESKLLGIFEHIGKTSYDSSAGRFGVSYRSTVRVPQGEARLAFFDHLKTINEFDTLITVNSQTLNGWFKQKQEAAREAGDLLDFKIPGIEDPSMVPIVSFRKKQ